MSKEDLIESLERRNKILKRELDSLCNIGFFGWMEWFIFGSRIQTKKALNKINPDFIGFLGEEIRQLNKEIDRLHTQIINLERELEEALQEISSLQQCDCIVRGAE